MLTILCEVVYINVGAIHSYISLFSSAGIGCYGFKEEGFECIATNELLEKRLKIQKYNLKCRYDSGYICGDIKDKDIFNKILSEINLWKEVHKINNIDVIIATPPCQGISIANHKKNSDEIIRNSLVIESLKAIKIISPKLFILENVRSFLKAICTDIDGKEKKIKEAIESNLSKIYDISYNAMNFKSYGCPSSRTRTLIIGVRRDLAYIKPYELLPNESREITLKETIGHLPLLKTMGEFAPNDIYHNYKNYDKRMIPWIENLIEGQSAFENKEIIRIPHTIKDGNIVYNKNKNGDKYRRQYWNKVAPCIHTRNDILSSQNTVHPIDNRVFSIRELMLMMSIPCNFRWTDLSDKQMLQFTVEEKKKFLKREEINIRQSIGEAVPTIIFRQIAHKIRKII
ncbi:MAG: DNA cytosine methyltransferase [Clostridium sp.]|uniref:DNA cytosine methyltransferase n=1 Tax=Clostridium sp. TaxID=1506 RepID=UPI003D6D13BE